MVGSWVIDGRNCVASNSSNSAPQAATRHDSREADGHRGQSISEPNPSTCRRSLGGSEQSLQAIPAEFRTLLPSIRWSTVDAGSGLLIEEMSFARVERVADLLPCSQICIAAGPSDDLAVIRLSVHERLASGRLD